MNTNGYAVNSVIAIVSKPEVLSLNKTEKPAYLYSVVSVKYIHNLYLFLSIPTASLSRTNFLNSSNCGLSGELIEQSIDNTCFIILEGYMSLKPMPSGSSGVRFFIAV